MVHSLLYYSKSTEDYKLYIKKSVKKSVFAYRPFSNDNYVFKIV